MPEDAGFVRSRFTIRRGSEVDDNIWRLWLGLRSVGVYGVY